MSEPEIYLNGKKIGQWGYGYSYFYIDITNEIKIGSENVLAVKLTNQPYSSRWYPGAGLYRKVSIIVKDTESFDQWSTFITTPLVNNNLATVNIKTNANGTNCSMVTIIKDAKNNIVATAKSPHLSMENLSKRLMSIIHIYGVLKPLIFTPPLPN